MFVKLRKMVILKNWSVISSVRNKIVSKNTHTHTVLTVLHRKIVASIGMKGNSASS